MPKILILSLLLSLSLNASEDYSTMKNDLLLQKLEAKDFKAFAELLKRNNDGLSFIHLTKVLKCKTKDGRGLYLALSENLTSRENFWEFSRAISSIGLGKSFEVKNPQQLFKLEQNLNPLKKMPEYFLAFIDANGKRVRPFGEKEMLRNGLFADISGDGFTERAEVTNYRVDGADNIQLLEIDRVAAKKLPLFRVLFNWRLKSEDRRGEFPWDYQLGDEDGDGIAEVYLGPITETGFQSKVKFIWDAQKQTWQGPPVSPNDHYLLIDNKKDISKYFNELVERKFRFFWGARVYAKSDNSFYFPGESSVNADELSKPYKYKSLKGLTKEQLEKYFSAGRSYFDFLDKTRIKDSAPKYFWTMPAKQAALELLQMNRTAKHKYDFRLAIDDRDGKLPPEKSQITYRYESSGCYMRINKNFHINVEVDNSYIALSRSTSQGVVFYNFVKAKPNLEVKCVKLDYREAKYFADVLYWLHKARSIKRNRSGHYLGLSMSSADGRGTLSFLTDDETLGDYEETIWSGQLADRWGNAYGQKAFLNFVNYMFSSVLMEKFDLAFSPLNYAFMIQEEVPLKDESVKENQIAELKKILAMPVGAVSEDVLLDALKLLRFYGSDEFLPQLQALHSQLKEDASSPEFVGVNWLRKVSKLMI